MTTRTSPLPAELPEKPNGWRKRIDMHMNMGGGCGTASYTVIDAEGKEMPIGYSYYSNREKPEESYSGFTLPGVDRHLTWAELRAAWSAYYASVTTAT